MVQNRLVPLLLIALGLMVLAVLSLLVRLSGPQWSAAVIQSQVIALTNSERAANSVGTLVENSLLDTAAQAKADDMAAKGYFAHVGPDGKEPWAWIVAAGYDYHYAGENLAVRFSDSSQVVDAWMASPTHRANIVKPQYSQIGVADLCSRITVLARGEILADGTYEGVPATFVVQYFGAPAVALAAPQKLSGSGEINITPTPTPETFASPSTSAPTVAGAEADAPALAAYAVPQRSLWERLALFIATTLHSLLASVVQSTATVVIGDTGVSTSR